MARTTAGTSSAPAGGTGASSAAAASGAAFSATEIRTSVALGAPSTREDRLIPVYFGSSSSQATEASEDVVAQILSRLSANGSAVAVLEGHASGDGPEEWNQLLSVRRAEAFKALLVGRGAAAERLEVRGMGMADPLASNATPGGRARNRRVEVRF